MTQESQLAGLPEEIEVVIDTRSVPTSYRCVIQVAGAKVTDDSGAVYCGDVIGYGAVASVMERKLRDEYDVLKGVIEVREGLMEVTAIWDGDRLIDGDGANIAPYTFDEQDDV